MTVNAVRGALATDQWATGQRPEHYRSGLIRLYPEGKVMLTALTSKMIQKALTDDNKYHWFEKEFVDRSGDMSGSGLYTDAACSNAYVSGATAGSRLYALCAADIANLLVDGKVVILRDSDNLPADVAAEVTSVEVNGANSIIGLRLLAADVGGSYPLSGADRIVRIGSAYAEHSELPEAIHLLPTRVSNFAQTFQSSLEISRTAMKTRLRTGSSYLEQKYDALEEVTVDMELGFLWGQKYEGTGSNNKPKLFTYGLIPVIKAYASDNVDDYPTTSLSGYDGLTWEQGGMDWLDAMLARIFKYGRSRKLAFCGTGAINALQKLARTHGSLNITPKTTAFGLAIVEWKTFYGDIVLYTHPLFSHESTTTNAMVIFEPENLVYRYVDDLTFIPDPNRTKPQGGRTRVDGIKEGYLAECGLEFHKPKTNGYLTGLGEDHPEA